MSKTNPEPFTDLEKNLPHHEMILVEGGEFEMGESEPDAEDWEKPVHVVNIPSFFIGKYPVTQKLWQFVMGDNPSDFKGEDRPVENVSWDDTQIFLEKLNALTGKVYRLPTEAEWEFAARGGNKSEGYLYSGSDRITEVGWYRENSENKTHPVGQKPANELGIYDMSGNVWEWVEDQWHLNYRDAPTDGSAWVDREEEAHRVRRGGSWMHRTRICRISIRYNNSPGSRSSYIGLRLVLSL
jgi:sulfatase modifying factor 1